MNAANFHRLLRIEPLETRSLLAGSPFDGDDLTLDLSRNDFSGDAAGRNVDQNRPQQVQSGVPGIEGRVNELSDPLGRTVVANTFTPSPTPTATEPAFVPAPTTSAATTSASVIDATVGVDMAMSPESGDSVFRPLPVATENERVDANVFDLIPSGPDGGLIDLSPLQPELSGGLLRNDDHPWQLDSAIVPKIQWVIEQTSRDRHEVVDAVIENWFGGNAGTGGMIALEQIVLTQTAFNTAIEWIDVQLESDLKLHRSLGMIASGASTPLSDEALDAIMATLSEAAESQVQPIKGIHPIEMSKIAYPAIAVLTAAAIAARRRVKRPGPATPSPPLHS